MDILGAHRVHPTLEVFSVGARSPGAIRDQMLRAHMIVDQACDEGLISAARPLIVNGAGAAGATAAMRAAARGVRTILAEKAGGTFLRQAGSRRWIDPVLYDWPASHWDSGTFVGAPMPLLFPGGFADTVARDWQAQLAVAIEKLPIKLMLNHSFLQPSKTARRNADKQFQVVVKPERAMPGDTGHVKKQMVAMALWAHGYPREITEVDNYAGFSFWANDRIALTDFGIVGARAKVAISGGGDGAIQDFLRCIVKPEEASAKNILRSIQPLPSSVVDIIRYAEDTALRSYVWWSDTQHDHATLHRLEQAYHRAMGKFKSPQLKVIRTKLLKILRQDVESITMIAPCTHFGRCYALNHFLAKLFWTIYCDDPNGWPEIELITNNAAVGVASTFLPRHTCELNAEHCHGHAHQVQIGPSDCDLPPARAARAPRRRPARAPGSYNVVIIRHGIQKDASAEPFQREVLPYGLPTLSV